MIHRIAVDNRYKGTGLSSDIIKEVEQLCLEKGVHSIKVDTHQDNKSMQKLLQKIISRLVASFMWRMEVLELRLKKY